MLPRPSSQGVGLLGFPLCRIHPVPLIFSLYRYNVSVWHGWILFYVVFVTECLKTYPVTSPRLLFSETLRLLLRFVKGVIFFFLCGYVTKHILKSPPTSELQFYWIVSPWLLLRFLRTSLKGGPFPRPGQSSTLPRYGLLVVVPRVMRRS